MEQFIKARRIYETKELKYIKYIPNDNYERQILMILNIQNPHKKNLGTNN